MTDPVKRLLDIIIAAAALVLLSPVLLLLAWQIRRKLGTPVLFRQVRPGRGGIPFVMYKFRTMRDAENENGRPLPDAERLTPFGRKLRAASLDELPELWNVLKGDMSLVGPRPLLMEYLPLYNAEQRRRHLVRPGITGWAQAQAGEDSGETFPALALRHDDTLNIDLYYHPQLGKPQNNHYYYNEAEPDTPSPGLPPDPAADEPAPHYTTYDRLLETALKADGARYHIDCSAGASGDYHCLFLNAAQDKIRRTNVAGLPGQTFYIPGNGAIYSDTDDSNSRYYRVRQKWTLHNGEIQENEQPYHYLGLASQYRGILKADSGAHDRKTPLRLLERIGGKKTVAKIAAGEPLRILLADPNQPCAKDAQLGDSDLCADLWLLIQNKDGKTGWAKINYQRDTPDLEGLHPLAE